MTAEAPTCFIIAPIGESDSPTRKRSDQVFKNVICSSLETVTLKPANKGCFRLTFGANKYHHEPTAYCLQAATGNTRDHRVTSCHRRFWTLHTYRRGSE
jgi:hypothetical protein